MGHAILTKPIGLVKGPKDDLFFKKTFIFAILVRFWINDAQKRTLMATLLVGIDFNIVSLLFEIHMGKITHSRS